MKIPIVVIILSCVAPVRSAVFTSQQESDIEDFVNSVLGCRNITGLTLSVVKNGETWARGFGMADINSGRMVDNSTRFPIASLSKAFTMVLLGREFQRNGLRWNTRMKNLNADLYQFSDICTTGTINIADLLAHRSGISNVWDIGVLAGYPPGETREDSSRKIRLVPEVSPFRNSFAYSNLLYVALSHVTETLGNDTWENLLTSQIFQPIGMSSSEVLTDSNRVLQDDIARPYILKDGIIQPGTEGIYNITPGEATGGVISTGLDMLKWIQFNLDGATTSDGRNLLGRKLFTSALRQQNTFTSNLVQALSIETPTYPVDDVTTGYGFGWFTSTYRGFRKVWHSGGFYSYISYIWLYPEDNIGIFISVNGPGLPGVGVTAEKTILWYLSDILLGSEPWLNSTTACTFPSPFADGQSSSGDQSDLPRDLTGTFGANLMMQYTMVNSLILNRTSTPSIAFTGRFSSDLLPEVEILEMNGTLRFEMNSLKGDLISSGQEDEFQLSITDPFELAVEFTGFPLSIKFTQTVGNVDGFTFGYPPGVEITYRIRQGNLKK